MYIQDRVLDNADEIFKMIEDPKTHIYLCGLKGMEPGIDEAMTAAAAAKGTGKGAEASALPAAAPGAPSTGAASASEVPSTPNTAPGTPNSAVGSMTSIWSPASGSANALDVKNSPRDWFKKMGPKKTGDEVQNELNRSNLHLLANMMECIVFLQYWSAGLNGMEPLGPFKTFRSPMEAPWNPGRRSPMEAT